MRAITRFDRAKNVYGGEIGTGESAIVHHFFDARADGRNLRGEIGEAARPVANYCRKRESRPSATSPRSITRLSTFGSMLPPQSRRTTRLPASSGSCPERQAARVVAAAPSTTPFSNSTMRRIASAICSSFTSTTLIDETARCRKALLAHLRDGETVRERRSDLNPNRFSSPERRGKTRDVIGLDRDDLHLRPHIFHCERNSGEQPATADRHDNRHRDPGPPRGSRARGSLPGDYRRIVVTVKSPVPARPRSHGRALSLQNACPAAQPSRQVSGSCCRSSRTKTKLFRLRHGSQPAAHLNKTPEVSGPA